MMGMEFLDLTYQGVQKVEPPICWCWDVCVIPFLSKVSLWIDMEVKGKCTLSRRECLRFVLGGTNPV